jgi:hypothetical protein
VTRRLSSPSRRRPLCLRHPTSRSERRPTRFRRRPVCPGHRPGRFQRGPSRSRRRPFCPRYRPPASEHRPSRSRRRPFCPRHRPSGSERRPSRQRRPTFCPEHLTSGFMHNPSVLCIRPRVSGIFPRDRRADRPHAASRPRHRWINPLRARACRRACAGVTPFNAVSTRACPAIPHRRRVFPAFSRPRPVPSAVPRQGAGGRPRTSRRRPMLSRI